MIPTDTPSSAAARAARWPASPAPITRTSWDGTGADAIARNPDYVVGIRHFVIRHVLGEAGGAPRRTHLAYGSMLSVRHRAPPASHSGRSAGQLVATTSGRRGGAPPGRRGLLLAGRSRS